jgi:RNA polymerase primary sigma factor
VLHYQIYDMKLKSRVEAKPKRGARVRTPAKVRLSRRPRTEPKPVLDEKHPPIIVPPQAVVHEVEPYEKPVSESATTLQLYLREIGRVALLTPAEEIQLAARIKAGDDEAREHMIKANLRLVVKIAREYENLGLPLLDLINEGNVGLMKGVERFDPAKGAKLSTYAAWWIKQSIKRALANQAKTIRLPVHVVDKVAHIRRAELKLKEIFDRDPTDEELAEELGLKPQRVREYREAAKSTISLEAPLGHDDDSDHLSEVVADPRAEAPFERLAKDSDAALMREVFATLSPREQEILNLRFGLRDDNPLTLEEIGQKYGLTRERIRQIESEGLKKLRIKMQKRDARSLEGVLGLAA